VRSLVPEVAHAGEDHGHLAFVGGGDDFVVADAAPGLDDGGGTGVGRSEEAVGEGEEGVTGDDAVREAELGFASFPDGDFAAIDARHLARANPEGALCAGIHDGVAFDVFDHFPAKEQRGPFVVGRLPLGHDLAVPRFDLLLIAILHEETADGAAHVFERFGAQAFTIHHEAEVLLFAKAGEGFLRKIGRDDDFAEDLADRRRKVGPDGLVDDDDAAKGCLPVGGKGLLPGFHEAVRARHATGVGVLEDGDGGLLKLTDQVSCGRDVDEVVKAERLAL